MQLWALNNITGEAHATIESLIVTKSYDKHLRGHLLSTSIGIGFEGYFLMGHQLHLFIDFRLFHVSQKLMNHRYTIDCAIEMALILPIKS